MALVAVAATARRKFPNQKGDRQVFEDFLLQELVHAVTAADVNRDLSRN